MQPTKGEDDSNARGLPREVVEWLESSFDAQLVLCERSVSRREGWLVDLRGKDAHRIEGFLRLERFVDGRLKEPNAQVATTLAWPLCFLSCQRSWKTAFFFDRKLTNLGKILSTDLAVAVLRRFPFRMA